MSASYMRKCTGKKRHETEEKANIARLGIQIVHSLSKGRLHVYRCDQCLGWHIGGTVNKFRKRRSGKRPNRRLRGRV